MHILIGIVGLLVAATVWSWRIRAARQALDDVAGIAGDVVAAARRLGFRRRANVHPVDSIDEPDLAVAALGLAFLDVAALPTAEQLTALKSTIRDELSVSEIKADEMLIVSRWLITECKTPQLAFTRILKRLSKLDPTGFQSVLKVLARIGQDADGALSPRQRDLLDEVAYVFRLK